MLPMFDGRIVGGEGRVDISPPPLEDRKHIVLVRRGGIGYYVQGTRVKLTAVPGSPDHRFVGWSGGAYGHRSR